MAISKWLRWYLVILDFLSLQLHPEFRTLLNGVINACVVEEKICYMKVYSVSANKFIEPLLILDIIQAFIYTICTSEITTNTKS